MRNKTLGAFFLLGVGLASAGLAGCSSDAEVAAAQRDADVSGDEREGVPAGAEVSGDGAASKATESAPPAREPSRACDFSVRGAPAEGGDDLADGRACRCTRRPGPGESVKCPAGEGRSVEVRIGPEGGVIELGGTASTKGVSVRLEIPPNALSEATTLRLTETTVAPPAEFIDWSPLYHLEPEGLSFARPAALRVPWYSNDGLVDVDLALYASTEADACALAPLDDSYVNAGFNQGSLRQSGWLMVGRPRTAAEAACP